MKKLRDYQEKSQVILAKDTSGLDASEMGTGKTLTGVERVREIGIGLGRAPRAVVVAPRNTQKQWLDLFAEQFPSLAGSDRLRVVSTPKADPESWERFLLKKSPGIFIVGWEAMRGICPKQITVIKQEAADRIERARTDRRILKKIMARKASPPEQREFIKQVIAECDEEIKVRQGETAVTKGVPPEGWIPKDPGGASRGYGTLYKKGSTLTKKAVTEAMKCGDVPPWLRTGTWDLVIADESHRMARKDSINKITMSVLKTNAKLAMSATPAGNKPQGMWSTLNWLWPQQYTSFWNWANVFMLTEDTYVAGGSTVPTIVGEKDPGATWVDIPCKVRHRVADVRGQLPDVIERVVEVDMTAEQRRIYDEFADQSLAWIDDQPVGEPLPLSQRIRLRQAALGQLGVLSDDPKIELGFSATAPNRKIDMIADILTDLLDGEPVIVYTHSRKWADMARERLSKAGLGQVVSWTGMTTPKVRQIYKETFGTPGGPRLMVAQLQAIGEGVDGLQHHCACEIWASPSEDGLINEQVKGRLHRDGQQRIVQRWLLQSTGSIDVDLDASLRQRRAQMKQFYRDKEKKA